MGIGISILAILFGLLHIAAAATQFRSTDFASRGSAIMMVCGGITVVCAAITHITGTSVLYVDALSMAVGSMLISFAAYLNGKRVKKFNPRHHMIRALIEALLVVGVILW
jgi:hypothetical protein